jgi:hypothetical protein
MERIRLPRPLRRPGGRGRRLVHLMTPTDTTGRMTREASASCDTCPRPEGALAGLRTPAVAGVRQSADDRVVATNRANGVTQ